MDINTEILNKIDHLKNQIDAHRPLPAEVLDQLKQYFRIGLTYSSNALEGNSLTEVETKVVIEDGLTVSGKSLRDHYEAVGHSKAYDLMFSLAQKQTITAQDALELHKLFYQGIDELQAGKLRAVSVHISGSQTKFPKPEQLKNEMEEFTRKCTEYQSSLHPVEQAARVHLNLVMIHPFVDGNGRTARLLSNVVLLQHGYTITIIPPVCRVDYIRALQKAPQDNGEEFVQFIMLHVFEACKEYLRLLS